MRLSNENKSGGQDKVGKPFSAISGPAAFFEPDIALFVRGGRKRKRKGYEGVFLFYFV